MAVFSLMQIHAINDVLRIVHQGITEYAPLSAIDSIYFDEEGATMFIQPIEKVAPIGIARTDIDNIDYLPVEKCPSKISIVFNGDTVSAENPFFLSGVSIAADGAYVTVKNTNITTEYTTDISGSTTDGGFTYQGDYKTTIVLNGVSIISQHGAAVDIECGKRIALELKKGTVNTLVDAAGGKQKAALYCKGHLEIDKTGTLNVTGNTAHAISAKEYIQLKKSTGIINILGAKNDGIHCKQYFYAKGFTVNISGIEGDGIQAEVQELEEGETYGEDYENGSIQIVEGTFNISSSTDGGVKTTEPADTYYSVCLKADKVVNISGGTFLLANSGSMSKSIKAGNSDYEGTVSISGGNITCNVSGDMYLIGTDATYCAAIKTDNYYGTGGAITINTATVPDGSPSGSTSSPSGSTGIGKAIRGISADNVINISDGVYNITNNSDGYIGSNDTYTAKGLTCDKDIILSGGTFVIKSTGTGGKCIKADGEIIIGTEGSPSGSNGPVITASTTGAGLGTSSGGRPGGGPGGPGGGPGGPGGGWGGQQSSLSSSSKAIKAIGQIIVNGGNLTVTTATDGAEGLESKTSVLINGGNHYFKCYDDCINSAGIINFAGGNTVCYSTGNDAIDSNYGRSGAITISGGNVFAYTTAGGPEEGFDCDNNRYIVITGGIAVSAGGRQGGGGGMGGSSSESVGSSTQGYFLGGSPSSYNTTNYYTLCNTSGEEICTYKFEGSVSNSLSLLTAPNLGKGSITVKQGTEAPTACTSSVNNANGQSVFFISPTVATTGTAATVTAK